MKILIVNRSDIQGGAARAAYRLHESLLEQDVVSQMLVMSKSSDVSTVVGPSTQVQKAMIKPRSVLDSLPVRKYKSRTKTLFSPAWLPFSGIVERINDINPDIVHLHWVNGGLLRVEELEKIKAPVIWSLHDMWPFTGGCHYDEECAAYTKSCGNCPVLGSDKAKDLSRKTFQRKLSAYQKKQDIIVIGLSRWMADEAASSALFSGRTVVNLPNPINTHTFSPFDRIKARELLNLPKDKALILFGAMSATSDPRKGFDKLSQALNAQALHDTNLVIFGSSEPVGGPTFRQKTHYLGRLHDDATLRALYSAADVMLVPSLQENLSNTIMESLACGTPVVAFDVGGNSDLVEHKSNGYLAKAYDTNDLAAGIDWVLSSSNYSAISAAARKKVLDSFDSNVVAERYIALYKEMLNKWEKPVYN